MCRGPVKAEPSPRWLLVSKESFHENEKAVHDTKALVSTLLFYISILYMSEMTWREIIASFQHLDPLLENETNRQIIARHVGVDAFGCFVLAYFGFKHRHVMQELIDSVLDRNKPVPPAYENRMFKYQPDGTHLIVLFASYQIKNSIDSIIWRDGPLFYLHHFLTVTTSWGALFPGVSQFYAPFYFGVSELSTAVLALLSNFDDEFGVAGLGDAFPVTKAVLGASFAVCFIMCRVLIWGTVSRVYFKDSWAAMTNPNLDPRFKPFLPFTRYLFCSLCMMTVLQIIWLGDIFTIGYSEAKKMGIL